MRALFTLVLLLAVVALVVEIAAPRLVEAGVEETVRARTDGAAEVSADAGEFPFVPRLLRDGVVERLDVTLDELRGQEVTLGTVRLGLDGIRVDRRALLSGDVRVTDLDAGRVVAEIERQELEAALGVDPGVELDPEAVDLVGRALEIAVANAPTVEVPSARDLLPCEPQTEVVDDVIRLHCEFDEVPGVLVPAEG